MIFCPLIAILVTAAIINYNGSILDLCMNPQMNKIFPQCTMKALVMLAVWIAFQAGLYCFLPGNIGYGQPTPAGHVLPYNVNGLQAWILTHALFLYGAYQANWWYVIHLHNGSNCCTALEITSY